MEHEPYACSYRMMRAVADVAPEAMRRMVDFAVADEARVGWQRLMWMAGWLVSVEARSVLKKKPYVRRLARPVDEMADCGAVGMVVASGVRS